MNKSEFFNEFKELCEYYNTKIYQNKRLTERYYNKVKNVAVSEFKKMCDAIIDEFKFMPRVADFELTSGIGHRGRHYTKEYLESLYDVGG